MIRDAGLGQHMSTQTIDTAVRFEKLNVSIQFIYPISITLPKLAVLCLYYRLFATKRYRYSTLTIATVVIFNWLASLLMAIFICQPFGYLWMQMRHYETPGGCGDLSVAYCVVSIPNILTDVAILILPMHAIWHLQARTAQKVGLTITFLTGCMYVIISSLLENSDR